MYPHERSLVKQLADKPFAIIGVNSDSDLEEIREIVKEKNLTWRSFQNEQEFGEISDLWGIAGWPSIFLLDAEGKIRYRDLRGNEMDDAIAELLGELGHEVEIAHEEEKPKKRRKKKSADDTELTEEAEETDDAEDTDDTEEMKDAEKTDDAGSVKESDKAAGNDQSDDGGTEGEVTTDKNGADKN